MVKINLGSHRITELFDFIWGASRYQQISFVCVEYLSGTKFSFKLNYVLTTSTKRSCNILTLNPKMRSLFKIWSLQM